MNVQLQVYLARPTDLPKIQRLLQEARRSFSAFGREDLPQLLARENCMVAGVNDRLWAMLCVSVNRQRWAFVRGAAIADGWRTDDGLEAVLEPMINRLRRREVTHLAAYGTALWLVPALMRAGFQRLEWIVTLERHPRPLPVVSPSQAPLRPVAGSDLAALVELDNAAFDSPYRLASGELIELMVTSGHFVVAVATGEHGKPVLGTLAGYACADVCGEEGQIIRLAVHPDYQRQGIGRLLLNDALAYCQAAGVMRVGINTQESNEASLQLYEQFGFRRVGRRIPLLARAL